MRRRKTTDEFIQEAIEVHGDKYDYSSTIYKHSKEKLIIICPVHGIFEQTSSHHLRGNGCNAGAVDRANITNRKTTKQFIQEAIEIHGTKYDYSLVEYKRALSKVKIICPIHGEFLQTANSHIRGNGCKKCAIRLSHEEFIERANEVHGNKYDYSLAEYIKWDTKLKIICTTHGIFEQQGGSHLNGIGCPHCTQNVKITKEVFIKRSNKIHKNFFDYSLVHDFKNSHSKVKIICPEHGVFEQKAYTHYKGIGCAECYYDKESKNYSKSSIEWMNKIMEIESIFIQHAENDGEFRLPKTRIKADGYCKETNTIYEFYGDFWHGNPEKFNPDEINQIINKPYRELYQKTIERENLIKELGYNLVTIWESDFY